MRLSGMKLNQRGGTLVTVLLVIIVFSVLGFALMGNVIGENKRTFTTESNMQARYLAESGLTYFEADFKSFIEDETRTSNYINVSIFHTYFNDYFLGKYLNEGKIVQSEPEKITVKAEWIDRTGIKVTDPSKVDINDIRIKVTSTGTKDSKAETLIGYYQLGVDIEKYTKEIADFEADGLAVDFAKNKGVGLDLLSLLSVELPGYIGDDETFYVVPSHSLIGVSALNDVITVDILSGNRFKMMEENSVIATRQGEFLGIDLFNGMKTGPLSISVLKLKDRNDTNVLIDGSYFTGAKVDLGIIKLDLSEMKYKSINFKKLAVLGNVIIKQDRVADKYQGLLNTYWYNFDSINPRMFTFKDGLYVNKSLVIGSYENGLTGDQQYKGISYLMLRGNMVAMKDLYISDVDLQFGDSDENETNLEQDEKISNIYVYGDATIKNTACIRIKNSNYAFRIFSKGKINIENNVDCNEYNGLFYAEKGINIKTNGKKIKIRGRLIGDVTIDGVPYYDYTGGNLEYPNYPPSAIFQIPLGKTRIIPKGRTFQK